VSDADVDYRSIPSHVVGPLGNGLAWAPWRKVRDVDRDRLSARSPPPTRIFKGSHQLLLRGIHRDHRVPSAPEALHQALPVAKLGIPIRVLGTFSGSLAANSPSAADTVPPSGRRSRGLAGSTPRPSDASTYSSSAVGSLDLPPWSPAPSNSTVGGSPARFPPPFSAPSRRPYSAFRGNHHFPALLQLWHRRGDRGARQCRSTSTGN